MNRTVSVPFLFIIFFSFCLSACVSTSPNAYKSGHEGSGYPLNELPLYGNMPKNQAMKKTDQDFLNKVERLEPSREKAAKEYVRLGWEYFNRRDYTVSIKRFNQAWLLYPNSYGAYWGFALILEVRDNKTEEALIMFEKGASFNPEEGNFFLEYGRMCEESGQLDKAVTLFEKGLGLEPKARTGYIGLVHVYTRKKDVKQLNYWVDLAEKRKVFSAAELSTMRRTIRKIER